MTNWRVCRVLVIVEEAPSTRTTTVAVAARAAGLSVGFGPGMPPRRPACCLIPRAQHAARPPGMPLHPRGGRPASRLAARHAAPGGAGRAAGRAGQRGGRRGGMPGGGGWGGAACRAELDGRHAGGRGGGPGSPPLRSHARHTARHIAPHNRITADASLDIPSCRGCGHRGHARLADAGPFAYWRGSGPGRHRAVLTPTRCGARRRRRLRSRWSGRPPRGGPCSQHPPPLVPRQRGQSRPSARRRQLPRTGSRS
jgi:hypothetical protein